MKLKTKLLFVVLSALQAGAIAATIDFTLGDDQFYGCTYEANSPVIIKVDTSLSCKEQAGDPSSICVGSIKCNVYNTTTGRTRWSIRYVSCNANSDGSCPLSTECPTTDAPAIVGENVKPVIRSKGQVVANAPHAKKLDSHKDDASAVTQQQE
ncbi:hypothetical protein K2X33_07270 [bacterium]|nr:hypothetical protein [bacterium]